MASKTYDSKRTGVRVEEATIAVGASLATAVDLRGRCLKAVLVPSGVEGAKIRFHRAVETTGTFHLMQDSEGTVIAVPFTAGRGIELNPALLLGALALKVETVASDGLTPVVQAGGDAVLQLIAVAP